MRRAGTTGKSLARKGLVVMSDLKDLGNGRYEFTYGEFSFEADMSGATVGDAEAYLEAIAASLQGGIGVWDRIEFASGSTHDGGTGWACRLRHAQQIQAVGRTRMEAAVALVVNAVSAMGDICRYADLLEMMSEGRVFGGIDE